MRLEETVKSLGKFWRFFVASMISLSLPFFILLFLAFAFLFSPANLVAISLRASIYDVFEL